VVDARMSIQPKTKTIYEKMLTVGYYIFLVILLIVYVTPFAWYIFNSFKTTEEANAIPPTIFPKNPTLASWINVLTGHTNIKLPIQWGRWMLNGIIVSSLTALYVTFATAFACYAIAKLRLKGARLILMLILAAILLPGPSILIPVYIIMTQLKLINNVMGLILLHPIIVLPLTVWITISTFAAIPDELEEAALIDGSSRIRTFFTIILPSVKMTLITTFVIAFLISWGEFSFSYVLLRSWDNYTPAIGVATYLLEFNVFWNEVSVSAVIVTLPVFVLFVLLRKHIVRQIFYGIVR
jgi:ABC-type glycerol-3-phosphate transport system permease component